MLQLTGVNDGFISALGLCACVDELRDVGNVAR